MAFSVSKYKADLPEQISKEKMIAHWIGRSGLPARTVEDDDFILMIESIDKKLAVTKKTKINNLVDQLYNDEKQKFREQLGDGHMDKKRTYSIISRH